MTKKEREKEIKRKKEEKKGMIFLAVVAAGIFCGYLLVVD